MTPPSYDFSGIAAEGNTLPLHTHWDYLFRSFILFLLIFSESTFYVMEGPCFEQSEPILQREPLYGPVGAHHQPAWTMNFKLPKPVKGLISAQEEWCEPWWTHYHPEIKFQSTAEKKNFGRKRRPQSRHGVHLKEKKSAGGWISTLDRTVWSCVCQPWQPRWDGEALVSSCGGNSKKNNKKKHVCAF